MVVIQACCASRQRTAQLQQRQSCLERGDTKLGLLSVDGPPSEDVGFLASVDIGGRRLLVVALAMVLGVCGWVSAAAEASLERRTRGGTDVAACFYAICTSALAFLLFSATAPRTWGCFGGSIYTRIGYVKRLSKLRCFRGGRSAGNASGKPSTVVSKQVVYSIANSGVSSFHACVTPALQTGEDATDADGPDVALRMRRDCTGSSCSLPASLSPAQLPVSEECWFCRSATDGSTDGLCLSRCSTRLRDFDDFSWCSDSENRAEGDSWNSNDDCSIHLAPCPSPASACSSHATKDLQEDPSSGPSPPYEVTFSHPYCRHARHCSGPYQPHSTHLVIIFRSVFQCRDVVLDARTT